MPLGSSNTTKSSLLVDSNHLRSLHAFKMPLHRYLENTLHGKVKPFITKCTLASILNTTDLQTSQRPDFLPPPTLLPLRHCSHSEVEEGEVLPEEECLLDLLGGSVTGNQQPKNKHHFVLATADPSPIKHEKRGELGRARRPMSASTTADMRISAREIPGVPVIYVKRSVMILEELSAASLGVRRREEKDKFREGLLGMGSRKRKRDEKQDEGDDDKRAITPVLKKKKAPKVRGPNPLSVLKKKPKPKAHQAGAVAEKSTLEALPDVSVASTAATQPKAKRRRKHVKKRELDAGGAVDQHDSSGPQERLPHAEEG